MKAAACPACGKVCDAATGISGAVRPKPGDYTVCLGCAAILRFDEEFALIRAKTVELLAEPLELRKALGTAVAVVRMVTQWRGRPL